MPMRGLLAPISHAYAKQQLDEALGVRQPLFQDTLGATGSSRSPAIDATGNQFWDRCRIIVVPGHSTSAFAAENVHHIE